MNLALKTMISISYKALLYPSWYEPSGAPEGDAIDR